MRLHRKDKAVLKSTLKQRVRFGEPLANYTSIRTGGPAEALVQPAAIDELCWIVRFARKRGISLFTIGAGCNIIVGKRGIKGICIRLSSPCFKRINFDGSYVKAGAGVLLPKLLYEGAKWAFSGFEFLAGIPGTVGGAIFVNAGTKNRGIASLIKQVEVVDGYGNLKQLSSNSIRFSYRASGLDRNIIVSAKFKFKKGHKQAVRHKIESNIAHKKLKQDYTLPSAGCIFKNPEGLKLSAAQLIESCGLKGKRRGNAAISKRHANFIVNQGNASPKDIFFLIRLMKKNVLACYGVDLKEEVKLIKG